MTRVELVSTEEATFRASATFSGDELATLYSSPKQLVPAPGPNKMIVPLSIHTFWDPQDNGYADSFIFGPFYGEGHLDDNSLAFFVFGENFPSVPPSERVSIGYLFGSPVGAPVSGLFNQPLYVGAAVFSDDSPDPAIAGIIASAVVQEPGSGYVVGDTGIFNTQIYGTQASYEVTGVDGEGGVVSFTWTNAPEEPGGYFQESAAQVDGDQPGVGTGFSITLENPPSTGTVTTDIIYQIIDNNG